MEPTEDSFVDDDHRAAFVFGQDDETDGQTARPTKRRKVTTRTAAVGVKHNKSRLAPEFVSLFNGAEKPELMELRQRQFAASWAAINARIQSVLRDSNRTTLDAVASFVHDAPSEAPAKIPAGLIVTGPNIASQDLLFSQLAESLGAIVHGRLVCLRSAEAPNLKATLKKIIRDVTRSAAFAAAGDGAGDDDDVAVAVGKDGSKYLDYDLEALQVHIRPLESKQVIVAFQDSEAFDTGLLSDLITLFDSWKSRISFTLLFGIATSVELFGARLPKSTSQRLYGAQFDVVQMSSILESVFKCAVAHAACPLKLGPAFLNSLVERQHNQVAGIHVFISSLKYAYMCHFYANPLSILLVQEKSSQPEHSEALRNLPSFRAHVEEAVEAGRLDHARSLLEDDAYLAQERMTALRMTVQWETGLLRSIALLMASGLPHDDFITMYTNALADGIDLESGDSKALAAVKRMSADDVSSLLQRITTAVTTGDAELGLKGWGGEHSSSKTLRTLVELTETLASLQADSQVSGKPLRSQYSSQSRILRTTVVAQKVQLSQDESNLTGQDKAFTKLVDRLVELLALEISCTAADTLFLHELWMYESKAPYKDVFIPRPGTIFERALLRPHDYLACACCSTVVDGGNGGTLPATSILYHLYEEAGALMNVADLWTAFYALVGKDDAGDEPSPEERRSPDHDTYDERTALVLFYQGLAELKAMGFVKATRRRADHVAKNKWLL